MIGPMVRTERSFVFIRPETNASAWRVVFVAGELVGWTNGEAKAAVGAVREVRFRGD